MRIVYMGSGQFGCDSLRWLAQSDHDVAEVITPPPRPSGRGRKLMATPIAQLANELSLPLQEIPNVNEPAFVQHIVDFKPQILMVIAFGQKIGPELLNMPGCRVINLHGSLLPKYRGAAPINYAIINGEKETGLTIIELNDVWDGGNILGQVSTKIKPQETAGELHDRLAQLGPKIIEEVLTKISDQTDHPLLQDQSQVSVAHKLTKDDGAIRWERSAREICCQIHGMWPWPGAFCFLQQQNKKKNERVSIACAKIITTEKSNVPPGTILPDMSIACGCGTLGLIEVKPENSKLISFDDFVNGRHLKTADRFSNGISSQ